MIKRILLTVVTLFISNMPCALANTNELYVAYTYESDGIKNILQKFGELNGINIRAEFLGVDELKPKMMAMVETQNVLDAVIAPSDNVGMHPFLNYSEVSTSLFTTPIPERIWACGLSDGKFYGAPILQGNYLLLFYNKSLVSKPPKDWEDLVNPIQRLKEKGITTLVWHHNSSYLFLPFLDAFGGWPFKDGKVTLNSPGMVKALSFYKDLRVANGLDLGCDFYCARDQFKAGKAAYILTGIWDAKELHAALGDNLGIAALPNVNGKTMVSPFSTYVMLFPNQGLAGKERDALIKLVNYLQSTTVQQEIWDQSEAIPVTPAAFEYAQASAKGYVKQSLELMANTKPVPADPAMSLIWDAIYKGKARHQAGGMSAERAAMYMQQLFDRNQREAEMRSEAFTKPEAH